MSLQDSTEPRHPSGSRRRVTLFRSSTLREGQILLPFAPPSDRGGGRARSLLFRGLGLLVLRQLPLLCVPHGARLTIALAVLSQLSFAAGSGRASCGDYVHIAGPTAAAAAALQPAARHGQQPDPARPSVPRNGPRCSHGPARVPPAPVAPPVPASEHWAVAVAWRCVPQPDHTGLTDAPAGAGGICRCSPPAPPPRLPVL
jgi:hypothetical protein